MKSVKNITVYKDPKFYSSFPSVVKLPNGNLLLVFRQAGMFSVSAAKNGLVTHHDSDTWISSIQSTNDGESWETYRKIYQNKSAVNDPGLTLLDNGKLLLRFNSLNVAKSNNNSDTSKKTILSHRIEHGLVTSVNYNVILISEDYGKTWSNDEIIIQAADYTDSSSREAIIQLEDGTLILSVYKGAPATTDGAFLLRSFDGGVNWGNVSTILKDKELTHSQNDGFNYNETAVIQIKDNHFLAVARTDVSFHTENESMIVGGIGEMTQVESFDAGLSWSKPKLTGIFGQPPHLLRIDENRIVMTYGYRKKPYGIKAVISYDNGKNWDTDNTLTLREDGLTWDIGYPTSVMIGSSQILTIYYFVDKDGTRFIESTKWSLED